MLITNNPATLKTYMKNIELWRAYKTEGCTTLPKPVLSVNV